MEDSEEGEMEMQPGMMDDMAGEGEEFDEMEEGEEDMIPDDEMGEGSSEEGEAEDDEFASDDNGA